MALTIEEVRKIASLARLRFSPEEEATFAGQLGKIVDYIDQLQRFEPGAGAAAAQAVPAAPGDPAYARAAAAPAASREADDRTRPCLPRESFLRNAPAALDGFLLVPEVKPETRTMASDDPLS
jgi:aspartyl-tRNA(Asn)/glutamyl-tRNA(Gln) amidotransferase subunit C